MTAAGWSSRAKCAGTASEFAPLEGRLEHGARRDSSPGSSKPRKESVQEAASRPRSAPPGSHECHVDADQDDRGQAAQKTPTHSVTSAPERPEDSSARAADTCAPEAGEDQYVKASRWRARSAPATDGSQAPHHTFDDPVQRRIGSASTFESPRLSSTKSSAPLPWAGDRKNTGQHGLRGPRQVRDARPE